MGIEFAILASTGGGVDFDLLEFNEGAGNGRPAGDSRKGIPVVRSKGGGAEVAVFEEELAVVGGVKQGVGVPVEGCRSGGDEWWRWRVVGV